jgi:hypothetical protein
MYGRPRLGFSSNLKANSIEFTVNLLKFEVIDVFANNE